jgi:hypothetical protein
MQPTVQSHRKDNLKKTLVTPHNHKILNKFHVRFSNRALMSSSLGLWHIVGRVLAWVTLLFAVGTGGIQPLQA